jgi:hypothetical protein
MKPTDFILILTSALAAISLALDWYVAVVP